MPKHPIILARHSLSDYDGTWGLKLYPELQLDLKVKNAHMSIYQIWMKTSRISLFSLGK